jgi:O-antigen ligase
VTSRGFALALGLTLAFGVLTASAGDWAVFALQTMLLLEAAVLALWVRGGLPAVVLPLMGAAVWGTIQIVCGWSEYPFAGWNSTAAWVAAAAAVYLGSQVLADDGTRRRAGTVLCWSGFLLSAGAILQWYTGAGKVFWLVPTAYTDSVVGPFLNRDQYAAFVELILPVVLYRAFRREERTVIYVAMAATMVGSVVATGSRAGSFIVTAEVLAFCGMAMVERGRAGLRVAGLVLAAGVIATLIAGWEFLWQRLQVDDQLGIRRYIYQSSMAMVRDRPLTGFGLGCWPEVYPQYALFDDGTLVHHAHNDWLEWMGEGGLPLGVLMLGFAVAATRAALRFRWGLGVPAVLIHGLLDFPMQKAALAAVAFVIAGALTAASRAQRRGMP